MILISHRGNIDGKNITLENDYEYVLNAINNNYQVEIDIWIIKTKLYIGHDEPKYESKKYKINELNHLYWFHAKNLDALLFLIKNNFKQYFWHQNDDFALTNNNLIWTYPNKELSKNSIAVLPELANYTNKQLRNCYGICSDVISSYKNLM